MLLKNILLKTCSSQFRPSPQLWTLQVRHAGHSKWQNIRHTKEAKDREKSLVAGRYARLLRKVAREGGTDPKLNNKLADVIAEMKKNSVSMAIVDRAIESVNNSKNKPCCVEFMGIGELCVMAMAEVDNVSTFRYNMKSSVKKFKEKIFLVREGATKFSFEPKGVIKVSKVDKNGNPITFEKAEELAIEAEAEEVADEKDFVSGLVEEETEDNEKPEECWVFKTEESALFTVKKQLENSNVVIKSAEIEQIPVRFSTLDDKGIEMVFEFVNVLQEIPEVNKIFCNIR